MTDLNKTIKGDKGIWAVVIALSIFSLLSVFSSSGSTESSMKDVLKHSMILLFSFAIIYTSHLVSYRIYFRYAGLILIIAIVLLIITIIFGETVNQATRTLRIPILNISFQTSDFAKIALFIYLAKILSKNQDNIKDFKKTFLPLMIPIAIICLLILKSNLSTTLFVFASSITLIFIGRVDIKQLLLTISIGVIFLFFLLQIGAAYPEILPRLNTWNGRFKEFFEKGKDVDKKVFNQENISKIAIADGKLFGVMPGRSKQRNSLANASSDFIYAIIVEEYGLIGGIVIILLYLILFYRSIRIATKTTLFFGGLMVFGCSFLIVFQAFIIMGYTVGLLPVTGLPLPLISMGGTSLWFTALNVGIILSVSREIESTSKENTTDATV